MKNENSTTVRRNIMLSIALFSCIQITLGFALITNADYGFKTPTEQANIPAHKTFIFKKLDRADFLSEDLNRTILAGIQSSRMDEDK